MSAEQTTGERPSRPTDEQIRVMVIQKAPMIRELAPKEFDAIVSNSSVLADRLVGFMQGGLQSQEGISTEGQDPAALPIFIAAIVSEEAVVEVGAVVAGVIAGDIVGNKTKLTAR